VLTAKAGDTESLPAARRSGATQEKVRRHNLSTLLRAVHETGPLSRAELTTHMGSSRSTIKDLVAALAELGLVGEERPDGARGGAGRPSLVVRARTDLVQVLAADVGVDRVDVALVGLGGRVVARRHAAFGPTRPSAGDVVAAIGAIVDELLADPAVADRVLALGVSVPGVVRRADGMVRFAPNLGWVDEPFGRLLTRGGTGLQVQVGNDANLGALAEHRRGVSRGCDDVVFLAGEVGVGAGLIVNGQPMLGAAGYAGEVGHLVVRPEGRPCRCGARGCWETEIGSQAIARALGMADATSDELVPAIRAAGRAGGHELDEVGHYLGLGLASIVNAFDPRLVVLGGMLREVLRATPEVTRASLDAAALAATAGEVELAAPSLEGDAVLIGAAEMAWEDLLADPVALLHSEVGLRPA
jgi:predicted NBD/HSP70 family sugar kinase